MIADSFYPSLLQGVSQQVLQNRREGQLSEQINMLSDAVTGPRRRPGIKHIGSILTANSTSSISATYLEFEGVGYRLFLNSTTGQLIVTDTDYVVINTYTDEYFEASDISKLRMTSVAGSTWIANTEKKPVYGTTNVGKSNPDFDGWFYVLTGAYSKEYKIKVVAPGFDKTYTYTTPDGSSAGHVALSTPEAIAGKLRDAMVADATFVAKFDITSEGSYVFFTRKVKDTTAGITTVSSFAGKVYMIGSGAMSVALQSDLPANLPVGGNGCITSVGSTNAYGYFKWDDSKGIWVESSKYGSLDTIINMPRKFGVLLGVMTLEAPDYEGRLAGDDDNNPYPAFLTYGITGLSAYQGRLVILSNGYASMSSSNRPLRFMRSTVTALLSDDPIEISAGALASASFEYAVPFNKDLMLISKQHQAVVPANTTGITASNAMVVLSSTESVDTLAEPKIIGRTLMYSTAVSAEYFGVGEMVPSQYSEAQYTAQNNTEHIPRYIGGRCRSIVSSGSNNLGLFLSSTEHNVVLVNEYVWQGDERPQSAWYKWVFSLPICSAHFANGQVVITMQASISELIIGTLDPRSASYQQAGTIPPFLDSYTHVDVVDNKFTVPVHLRNITLLDNIRAAHIAGGLSGEPIGIADIDTSTWIGTTVRSFANGTLGLGWKYSSVFTPSSPLIRTKEGQPIMTAHANVLKYVVNVRNTGEFFAEVATTGYDIDPLINSAVLWSSSELGLGSKQAVEYGYVTVPVRAKSENTLTTLSIDSTRELNIVSIEYTIRGVQKRSRV